LPDQRIPYARAQVDTVAGPIASAWMWTSSGIEFTITIPPNVRAEIAIPGRTHPDVGSLAFNAERNISSGEVEPGEHIFTVSK